jgi:hypothetical protein
VVWEDTMKAAMTIMLVLVALASFMAWHVVHWLCLMQGIPAPGLVAWVLAVPIGAWLVFK